ncbi:P-type conjugative transfer protein VirB9 [Rickettsiales endosymbiont of Peranema trichophorum]|nr:P-type conjugative transfer protein VirB9 [Rickettsiales endosymbiont of Peranema trichophorum]
MLHFIVVCCVMIAVFGADAFATSSPRALGNESRIKIVNYMPNTVFKFVGHYMYQSIIEFGMDEEIDTISMGTPSPWQLIPAGNRIFIKPVEEDATTNMTVITNKRMYFFEMHAKDASSIDDDELSFVVKFVYPDEGNFNTVKHVANSSYGSPDLTRPQLYNFQYTLSGNSKLIEPTQVFDDGEFTYFKFRDVNAELPAIFLVDSKSNESLVNYRISGQYVVVELVAPKFTLRSGDDVICVFNERMEKELKKIQQSSRASRK